MRRERVDSISIVSIGYDPRTQQLEIEFRGSRDVYLYFGVPREEHAAFMAAESKGTYLNQVFKPHVYHYVVQSKGKKQRSG